MIQLLVANNYANSPSNFEAFEAIFKARFARLVIASFRSFRSFELFSTFFSLFLCFQGLKSYAVQFFNGRRKHRKSDGKRHFRQHFGRMQSNNKWTYVRLWLRIADFKSLCGILGRILEIDVNARAGNGCVSKAQTFQCNRRINLQNLKLFNFFFQSYFFISRRLTNNCIFLLVILQ